MIITETGHHFLNPHPPLNGTPLFSLRDVSVSFGSTTALKNINLDVQKGEILFVTGFSGAGKTTLLTVLAGHTKPTAGTIETNLNQLFISQVFQDLRLIMDISIKENLMFAYDKQLYSCKDNFLSDLYELANGLNCKEKLDMKMNCTNGGLKQKTAIMRALLSRPDVLIADEPTAQLDLKNAQNIFNILDRYNTRAGMTIIWATHNKDLVRKFSGRILHINKGQLVYSGNTCFI